MQLRAAFTFLLTGLLFVLTRVGASPTKRSPSLITLPLKRSPQPAGVLPAAHYQQHINRSHRRHARMNGLEGPTDVELAKRLQKRLDLAEPQQFNKRSTCENVKRATDDSSKKGTSGFPEADLNADLNDILTEAKEPTAADSLGLNILAYDAVYIVTIEIGSPPRDFSVFIDSGSANLWVGGEGCVGQNHTECDGKNRLGPKISSTFRDTKKDWEIDYSYGTVKGHIVSDDVKFAHLALGDIIFGTALSGPTASPDPNFDGIMGLAKSSLSTIPDAPTPVEVLAKKGLIKEAITSYKISRLSDGHNDGEIMFGGLDQSKFDPKTLVTMPNVNKDGYWEADLAGASVDGKDLGFKGRTAIFDTGSTLLTIPEPDAGKIHAKIPGTKSDGQGGYLVPCTTTAVVSFTIGNQKFDINPLDLLFGPVDQNNLKGDCYSGIIPGDVLAKNQWLLGNVFLKNAYFSHNVDKDQINLAKLV